jgi:hypothetical protein
VTPDQYRLVIDDDDLIAGLNSRKLADITFDVADTGVLDLPGRAGDLARRAASPRPLRRANRRDGPPAG